MNISEAREILRYRSGLRIRRVPKTHYVYRIYGGGPYYYIGGGGILSQEQLIENAKRLEEKAK